LKPSRGRRQTIQGSLAATISPRLSEHFVDLV
jgi:hypothetical protein